MHYWHLSMLRDRRRRSHLARLTTGREGNLLALSVLFFACQPAAPLVEQPASEGCPPLSFTNQQRVPAVSIFDVKAATQAVAPSQCVEGTILGAQKPVVTTTQHWGAVLWCPTGAMCEDDYSDAHSAWQKWWASGALGDVVPKGVDQ